MCIGTEICRMTEAGILTHPVFALKAIMYLFISQMISLCFRLTPTEAHAEGG